MLLEKITRSSVIYLNNVWTARQRYTQRRDAKVICSWPIWVAGFVAYERSMTPQSLTNYITI